MQTPSDFATSLSSASRQASRFTSSRASLLRGLSRFGSAVRHARSDRHSRRRSWWRLPQNRSPRATHAAGFSAHSLRPMVPALTARRLVATRVPIDPDKGVPDLVRQLTDDSKRLLGDEVRLAKLETAESLHHAGRGALWLGLAFGVGVVMLVAFTLFFATLFGRIANG